MLHLRLASVAVRLASRENFDEFVSDVTRSNIGLLKTIEDLDSLIKLVGRSDKYPSVKTRLQEVKNSITSAVEVLRSLDRLYATGNLAFGNRAPRVDKPQKAKARSLELSQERPTPSRPTRFK